MVARLRVLALRARQLRFLLGEVRGMRGRIALIARAAASRILPGALARRPALASMRLPFRRFELEFSIGEGEILNYEPVVRDLEQGVIPTGPGLGAWTVVDCGASIGIVSLFLREARRIIAIEPQPAACARLRRNLEANGVAATVVQKAVSAEPGTMRMDLFGIFSRISDDGSIAVEATTIDEVCDEQGVESVDLLKLDVEEHGFEALRGAAGMLERRSIRRVCAEFVDFEELGRLDATLATLGFARTRTGEANALYELAANEPPAPGP